MLHRRSGSRERWTLSPLSPFHLVWDSVLGTTAPHSYLSLPYSFSSSGQHSHRHTQKFILIMTLKKIKDHGTHIYHCGISCMYIVGTDQLRPSAFPSCFSGDFKPSLFIHKILPWFGLWSVSKAHILKVRSLAGVTVWEGDGNFRMWSLS